VNVEQKNVIRLLLLSNFQGVNGIVSRNRGLQMSFSFASSKRISSRGPSRKWFVVGQINYHAQSFPSTKAVQIRGQHFFFHRLLLFEPIARPTTRVAIRPTPSLALVEAESRLGPRTGASIVLATFWET